MKMKAFRNESLKQDEKNRVKMEEIEEGKYQCMYCGDSVDKDEYEEHWVTHPTQIRQRIWLGNAVNAQDVEFFNEQKITHVLNCTKEVDCPKEILDILKGWKRIAVEDKNMEDINAYFAEAFEFIEKSLGEDKDNILFIHCREGKSRSASFLTAYFMWKEGLTFDSAMAEIRSKRHIILPNPKFEKQLQELEKLLLIEQDLEDNQRKFGVPQKNLILAKIK